MILASGREHDKERRAAIGLSLACLLSGAAALAYQILWTRQLSLVLGTSMEAVAVVLSSFMAGLGLGNALAARGLARAGREGSRQLVRTYALLEVGIAGAAVVLPLAIGSAASLLAPLYDGPSASPLAFRLGRLALSFIILAVPTTAMGATLPLLVSLRQAPAGGEAAAAGNLYTWNTLGAVAGALLTPLAALPALGMTRTGLLAAMANVAAALLVWGAKRETGAGGHADRRPEATPMDVPRADHTARGAAVLMVTFLSGLGALAHELAWTRALVLLVGPTAYAFAFVLAAVIAGLALGSAIAARIADRLERPALALAAVQSGVVVAALGIIPAVGALPVPIGDTVRVLALDPSALLLRQAAGTFVLLVLPSAFFGATFPLCVRLLANTGLPPGIATARLLTCNTLGAVLGPLAAGFWLLPTLGLEATLKAAALVHALAALVALQATRPKPGLRWVAFASLPAAALLLLPRWDLELLAGGAYRYAHREEALDLRDSLRAGELLYYRDGAFATVSVKRVGGAKALAVDGKVDATNTGDMATQRLLGHLPLLLHGAPRHALVVGLGSGATAAAVLSHPVESLEVAEISPEVAEAARLHFADVQQGALDDPRLRLRLIDARNHLLLGSGRYDVIVSEPSNPWMAGVSNLFTLDFFRLARARLRPGGLLCQWMHVYGMPLEAVRTVVGGFADVFPESAVFQVSAGDVLLVGSAG
ncbi:MAG TPA: fused MFS/spermidine synthase, partial [Vicinamibacteria bacterium]